MHRPSTFPLAVALAIAVSLFAPATPALVGAADRDDLAQGLADLVRDSGLGDAVGIAVVDIESRRPIFRHRADMPMNPASNMKLLTAAAALTELGPDFRMLTGLYGEVEPDGTVPELVLRGYGDPTLLMSDLVELAEQLADRGVRRVRRVVVDGSYFDDRVLPPAFEQQPDEVAPFRAPVGAVSVERSAYLLRVLPGPDGGKAHVRLAAEGYFDVDNQIVTKGSGEPKVIAIQRGDGKKMTLLLRGSIPNGILGVGYVRRVEHPSWYAGWSMIEALERAGIKANAEVALGSGTEGLPPLTSRRSPSVAELLEELGKHSDNFVAEMLLKVLGAEKARPGSSERGAAVLRQVLERAGVKKGSATIVNGSGLFEGNRVAADHFAALLAMMYADPAVRSEYVAHLAVGGVDGTLHQRLGDLPAPRIVRAKTGTLADTIALSGYVLGKSPNEALAFSVLANDVRGKIGNARKLADDVVGRLAAHLW